MNRAQRRAAVKKTASAQSPAQKSIAAQNRLVMVKNADRLSEEAQLDSRLKLYIMLDDLVREHREYPLIYMQHVLKHMKLSGILQNKPIYAEWIEKAAKELEKSAEGNRSFPWLTLLINKFDEEIGSTSAHMQVACNDHAGACGVLENIIGIINLPEPADDLITDILNGKSMKSAAAARGVSENKARSLVLDYVWHISNLATGDLPPCKTIPDVKTHRELISAFRSNIKRAASDAAAAIYEFHHRFGVSLIDIDQLMRMFDDRKEAA